ncbi:MAG: very short patch repair endonuclease [Candidatus Omnitrophica bacterium]|nr:very short patch repair endonuclease [Candidatus Omnitrophota bacterium]
MIRRPKETVSYNMSRIKATGSFIEKIMASALWNNGLKGYRKNSKNIFGKPDFSWTKYKVAVFCDSSFWHGYKWGEQSKKAFKVRKKFWINKIEKNIERDKKVNKTLRKDGWKVLRFWDLQIKTKTNKCVEKIWKTIKNSE